MRYITNTLFITSLLLPLFMMGQEGIADEALVQKKVTELYTAMVDRNKDTLEELTAEDLSYGHSSGRIENKSEYVDAVVNGSFDFLSIDAKNQTIAFAGTNAIVRHIFETKALDDGDEVHIEIGALLVFQNQDGDWKLLARQAYKL